MATKGVNITLKEQTIKRIKELAKKEGRSFSNMVEYILYSHCMEETGCLSFTMKARETSKETKSPGE